MAWLKKISSLSFKDSEEAQATLLTLDENNIEGVWILVLEPRSKRHA